MLHLFSYIFPAGQAIRLAKTGARLTNSSNPQAIAINVTLTVIDCCLLPPARLAAHCVGAGAAIAASCLSQ